MNYDERRWMLIGLKRYEGTDAVTAVPVDSPEASTVAVCVELDDGSYGPTLFDANEDRHGYVDANKGNDSYKATAARAQAIVDWHNDQLQAAEEDEMTEAEKDAVRAMAEERYLCDPIEFDGDAVVSESHDHWHVQGWVYVPKPGTKENE